MRVLVACEFSGVVRDAFIARGHDALSCDLLPTERPGPHYQGDVRDIIRHDWDMMIAFPPCTHLAASGARWFKDKVVEQQKAIEFFIELYYQPIPRIAIENPVGIMSTEFRKPDQVIQPYQFGHEERKKTCLWLKNLRPLMHTHLMAERFPRVHRESPGPDRWKRRSRTLQGIADAMAEQWNY